MLPSIIQRAVAAFSALSSIDGLSSVTSKHELSTRQLQISTDGTCGDGITCLGSTWGQCCSRHGYCGDADAYCGSGCNITFGICSSSRSSSSSTNPISTPAPSQTCRIIATGTTWVTTTTTVTTAVSTDVQTIRTTLTNTALATKVSTAVTTLTSSVQVSVTLISTVVTTSTDVLRSLSISVLTITSLRDIATTRTLTASVFTTNVVTTTTTQTVARTSALTVTVTRTTSTAVSSGGRGAATPSPTLPGTVRGCKDWYRIRSNVRCSQIADVYSISMAELRDWNLAMENDPDKNECKLDALDELSRGQCRIPCSSLWPGYYICVEA